MPSLPPRLTIALTSATLLTSAACGPGGDGPAGACADILPGELVITEIFADHAAPPGGSGADEGKEWFEIYNASGAPIDLEGLTLRHSRPDGSRPKAHVMKSTTLAAGGYLVVGNVLPEFVTGHLSYGYGNDLGDLFNTGSGKLSITCGTDAIDEVLYQDASSGRSLGFDGGVVPDYLANDDLSLWCTPPREPLYEFAPSNYGTPGATNYDCDVMVAGMCDDGGTLRPLVAPAVGDVVITEVHPRPAAVAATAGEWFEVHATTDVDLNGLGVGRIGATPALITSSACLRVEAGGYAVLARNLDMDANGGLPEPLARITLGLTDNNGDVEISYGGTALDSYAWPSVRSGTAIQLDASILSSTDNDDPAAWCDATTTYGAGDRGTPGAANAACGGTVGGTCTDPVSGELRAVVAPTAGQLTITEWMPDPMLVTDANGEWFELLASAAIDLNGLQAGTSALGTTPIIAAGGTCVRLEPGEYALLARTATSATNGLPDLTVTGTFGFGLVNGAGSLRIGVGGVELSAVSWAAVAPGSSIQLDSAGTQCNATLTVPQTATYNGTDRGTPKAVHTAECP